ncbi:aldehyde dehydrogenase family protein [Streptomyces sp. NBC_00827]|uniref:aldehyde dehydrogenase family protein n=1 Tax=Streptomyces sp. NBC_00827 TaxID=2903677 RepID=UPI00386B8590|nr:aldehyde dehydrogenase family protein [Streptomyces sp. NBC_00827]
MPLKRKQGLVRVDVGSAGLPAGAVLLAAAGGEAGRHLKRVVLQLSGRNPLLVLADADLSHAVDAAVYGAFVHQGQVRMCARRVYVERPIAEELTELRWITLRGEPRDFPFRQSRGRA